MDFRLLVSISTLIVSVVLSCASLYFARRSWSESNRPLITVKVSVDAKSGNNSVIFNLVVENTGNRPAKNIKLSVDNEKLNFAFDSPTENDLKAIEACFEEDTIISVLANGKSAKNGFGSISCKKSNDPNVATLQEDLPSTWKTKARFEVKVKYQDLDGRKYTDCMPVLIADNDNGFAGVARL
jgi:hypothetical protein